MTLHIGLLLFPRVQQLDLTGPYEVFASLPGAQMHLVARTMEPVASVTGLVLAPTATFAACPPLDVLCIPGGTGVNALLRDGATLDFVRGQAAGARYVTSVCTGALVLGAAGLLRDGSLVTGGGVTAGIDFALALAVELAGQAEAEAIQLNLEYAPAPPLNAGSPDTASPVVLEQVRARSATIRAEREAIVSALTGASSVARQGA
jgi:cyclohexyl-isocyanide hydratase